MDEILAMQVKKEELQLKVKLQILRAREYGKRVDNIRNKLEDTKWKNANLKSFSSQSFQLVQLLQFKSSTLENTLKDKDELLSAINSYCQRQCPHRSDSKKLEMMVQEFQQQCDSAPWLANKSQFLIELEQICNQLGILKKDIKVIENKIADCKKIVGSHQELSFHKFCIHLANFKRSMAGIRKLFEREMKLRNEHKERLNKRNSSDIEFMDISMMSDYVAKNMTVVSTTPQNMTSEVNKFSIFDQSCDQPRNEIGSMNEPFDVDFNTPSLFNKNIFGF